MSRWIKGLIVGLSMCVGLVVFGLPSTVHAYKVVTPGYSSRA
ncbi:hypothetical protein LBR03_22890 [Levilactobacillus brevis]|nr:hypothetical protein LBR03_22890 [Levilactobacillus brevis]